MLKAADKPVTEEENIQDWLELDEGELGFWPLVKEKIAAVIVTVFCISSSKIIAFHIIILPVFVISLAHTLIFRLEYYGMWVV